MTPNYLKKAKARFEKKFSRRGGCWIWSAGRNGSGLPVFGLDNKCFLAIRAAFVIYKGEQLQAGSRSAMRCKDRDCVNPSHLLIREGVVLDELDRERFEEKFEKRPSGCWEWAASVDSNTGYGKFGFRGETWNAHRVAWALSRGEPGDLHVLHRCDNPPCVNPDHLFLGTNHDNVRDMVEKDRHARGERQPTSKLKRLQAQEILDRYEPGKVSALAAEFGVSKSRICCIGKRRSWRHLTPST